MDYDDFEIVQPPEPAPTTAAPRSSFSFAHTWRLDYGGQLESLAVPRAEADHGVEVFMDGDIVEVTVFDEESWSSPRSTVHLAHLIAVSAARAGLPRAINGIPFSSWAGQLALFFPELRAEK